MELLLVVRVLLTYLSRGRTVNLPLTHYSFEPKDFGNYDKKLEGRDNALMFAYPAESEHMNKDEQLKKNTCHRSVKNSRVGTRGCLSK